MTPSVHGSVKVFIVASVIFKRRNPGAADDGSVQVLIAARVIFSGTQARGDPDASPTPDKVQV